MRRATGAALAVAVLALASSAARGSTDHVLYAWTELAPTTVAPSGLVARVVTDGAPCPSIALTGARVALLAMHAVTPAPGIVGFSGITACRATIPGGTTAASAAGHRLPLLRRSGPIAVVGDTGCAIEQPDAKGKQKPQDCNDPAKWPFAAIAARIAASKPQFVLHLGDYVYREAGCLTTVAKEQAKCAGTPPVNPAGSPNPDNWALWQTDFFKPAAPLLAAAPLVVMRGNHEKCFRAGNGYFLLLDPGTNSPRTCGAIASVGVTRPYLLEANGLRLVVIDSSKACDFNAARTPLFTTVFREAAKLAPRPGPRWLLSHRPLWGYVTGQTPDDVVDNEGCNATPPTSGGWKSVDLQVAASGLSRYAAVFSGHVHAFEAVQVPGRPAQLIAGNGGTDLNGGLGRNHVAPTAAPQGSRPASYANAIDEFGYALVTRQGAGWVLKAYGVDGSRQTTCPFGRRPMRCT